MTPFKLAFWIVLLLSLSSAFAQHNKLISDAEYAERHADALKDGVTFVSFDHGIYTFKHKDTIVRAKCHGQSVGFHYIDKVCDLGYWVVGETMQGFDPFTFEEGYATVDTTGVIYNVNHDQQRATDRLVQFDLVSWKPARTAKGAR